MPIDSNGVYSLPAGYLAVAGETILPSQHNPPLEDIASALSQVLYRSGVAPMMGHLNMNGYAIVNLAESSSPGAPVTNQQLLDVIADLQAQINAAKDPVGALLGGRWKTAPVGWVKEDGGTIGNATSGAVSRANADTEALFTHLWNNFTNAELPIYTSSGAVSARGASAAADFAANKRLRIHDSRTRFQRGSDDGANYDAGLTVGSSQADAIKFHVHPADISEVSVRLRTQAGGSFNSGSPYALSRVDGAASSTTDASFDHGHTATVGNNTGGIALETRPRSTVCLFCIKL